MSFLSPITSVKPRKESIKQKLQINANLHASDHTPLAVHWTWYQNRKHSQESIYLREGLLVPFRRHSSKENYSHHAVF